MKRRVWITAFVATAIAVAWVSYRHAHRYEVPVGHTWAWNLTADETPVRTELYEYQLPSGSQSSYKITGRKASFSFPSAYYFYMDNQRGGPVSTIGLSLSKENYRPISLLIKDKYKLYGNIMSKYRPEYSEIDLQLQVITNIVELSVFSAKKLYAKGIASGKFKYAGKACGFNIAYSTGNPSIIYLRKPPSINVEGVDLQHSDISGFREESNELHEISCGYGSPICIIKSLS